MSKRCTRVPWNVHQGLARARGTLLSAQESFAHIIPVLDSQGSVWSRIYSLRTAKNKTKILKITVFRPNGRCTSSQAALAGLPVVTWRGWPQLTTLKGMFQDIWLMKYTTNRDNMLHHQDVRKQSFAVFLLFLNTLFEFHWVKYWRLLEIWRLPSL